ncbi:MAG: DNA-binding domain-containing protein [Parachlamydiaceae bacterium]
MGFDQKVPLLLKREQMWFGQIIGRPIDEDSRMNPLAPSGRTMEVEASEHIVPSPTLSPAQRIQIYNQQYWWRLLNTMHELYPLVTRLFGYRDFNHTIAIPYLVKYPPSHWSLAFIGKHLSKWIEEDYCADDKKLVHQAAILDWSFTDSFITQNTIPLKAEDLPKLQESDVKLRTPPHLHLFQMEYDLFRYRVDFLKNTPEYWMDHDFPVLDSSKLCHFVLHRNRGNDIAWKEISPTEYSLLNLFKEGSSIDTVCRWIEEQGEDVYGDATNNLQRWFQEWTLCKWLSVV